MKVETIPQSFLSTSDGKWRVIWQGQPLCADTSRESAEKVAAQMRVTLADVVWNGDSGDWQPR